MNKTTYTCPFCGSELAVYNEDGMTHANCHGCNFDSPEVPTEIFDNFMQLMYDMAVAWNEVVKEYYEQHN